jgi:hypothetical protein
MVLKRIDPGSAFKVGGAIYGLLGLVLGVIFACISLFGAAFSAATHNSAGFVGMFFGVGAVIFLPLFYGLLGAVMAALTAWLYNSLIGLTGGLKIDLE